MFLTHGQPKNLWHNIGDCKDTKQSCRRRSIQDIFTVAGWRRSLGQRLSECDASTRQYDVILGDD